MRQPAHGPENRLWTSQFVFACLSSALVFFNVHLMLATFAAYAVSRFAVGDALGGTTASIFIVGALVSRLFAGPLMERFRLKAILYCTLAVFIVAPPVYLLVDGIGATIMVRILHGMAFGIGSSVVATLAVSRIPAQRIGEGTSHYASSTVLGVAAGPLIGLSVARWSGFEAVLWIAVISSTVALVLAVPVREPHQRCPVDGHRHPVAGDPHPGARRRRRFTAGMLEPAAVPIALVGALFTVGYASIVTFLGVFAGEHGIGTGVSLFFLAYAVVILFSRPLTGPLMDRRGFNVVMVPAFVLFACGLLVLSQATTVALLLLAAVLVGVGQGNLLSGAQTIAVTRAPRERMGMTTSTYFLGIDIGMGCGPMLTGLLVQWRGAAGTYGALAIYLLAVLAVYWFVQGRKLSAGGAPNGPARGPIARRVNPSRCKGDAA